MPQTLQRLSKRGDTASAAVGEAVGELLRWYRDCDASAAREAARVLRATRDRTHSSDPQLLALLGVALVRGPEVQVEHGDGAYLRPAHHSSNSEREGTRLLAQVTARTGWLEVAEELAAVALATRKPETLSTASRALSQAAEQRDDAALWSALAEVELARGDRSAAERAAAHEAASGSPRSMRVAGILRMLAGEDVQGAELYLRGLELASDWKDIAPFFDDLRMLLGEDELRQWNSLRDGHADWIRRKWEWRGQMAGVALAERLAVNMRRVNEAVQRFPRLSFRGAIDLYSIWPAESGAWLQPLDDRGVVFLRHGEPTAKVGNTWIYGGAAGKPMVLEFRQEFGGRSGYHLAEPTRCPVPQGRSEGLSRRRESMMDYGLSLATYDPVLGWYYIRCARNPEFAIGSYFGVRNAARRTAEAAYSSESGMAGFRQPLATAWNLYAFQTGSGPELVSYLSIAAGGIRRPAAAQGPIGFDVLLSVGDPVSERFTQLDTAITYTTRVPLAPDAVLHWALPIRTPSFDNARVTITVRNQADRSQGQVSSTTWSLPQLKDSLLISDLVVGEPRDGIVRRGTHALAPLPGHAVPAGRPFRLYHEVYGARPADQLSVTIRVLPAKAESLLAMLQSLIASRSAISLEFAEQAAPDSDGVIRMQRDIGAELQPGAYSLTVTVKNLRTGETTSADTNLIVLKP